MSKVLLINGSPHREGCVFTALSEMKTAFEKDAVDAEIFHIGTKPVRGCIACHKCTELGRCVFDDDVCTELGRLMIVADGIVIGSPVYYAAPNGALCALLDRVFYSVGSKLQYKPGAAVVSCRRSGSTAAFDRLNKYFTINKMPVVSSQYWNGVHGYEPEDVKKDLEGLQTMRTLARNMTWLIKNIKAGGITPPEAEEWQKTNFIR